MEEFVRRIYDKRRNAGNVDHKTYGCGQHYPLQLHERCVAPHGRIQSAQTVYNQACCHVYKRKLKIRRQIIRRDAADTKVKAKQKGQKK